MNLFKTWHIALCLSVLVVSNLGAEELSVTQAEQSFAQGEYAEALASYQNLFDRDPAPDYLYNIGVCHFKLGQWQQAYDSFRDLELVTDDVDLARYNQAVSLKKMGQIEQARAILEEIELMSDNFELALLASEQLQRLDSESSESIAKQASDSDIFGVIQIGFGNDDNVQLPDQDTVTNIDDNFIESMVSLGYLNYSSGWSFDALYYQTDYDNADDFSVSFSSLNAAKHVVTDANSHISFSLGSDNYTVGGEDYLSAIRAGIDYRTSLSDSEKLSFTGQFTQYNAADSYKQLDGTSYRLETKYSVSEDNRRWYLRARVISNDRDDLTTEDSFTSFSYLKYTVGAGYRWDISDWTMRARINYSKADYADDNALLFVGPLGREFSVSTGRRSDSNVSAVISAEYQLTKHWLLTAEFDSTNNSSNIQEYDYDNQVIMFGISYSF